MQLDQGFEDSREQSENKRERFSSDDEEEEDEGRIRKRRTPPRALPLPPMPPLERVGDNGRVEESASESTLG